MDTKYSLETHFDVVKFLLVRQFSNLIMMRRNRINKRLETSYFL